MSPAEPLPRSGFEARALPADVTLLPTSTGALLVSRSLATFCGVTGADAAHVRAVLDGASELAALSATLVAALERHGFFAAPRPAPLAPRLLKLQLTNACDLNCEYCCTNSGSPRPRELGRDDWFAIVDEAIELRGPELEVSLLGGEPLWVPFALELGAHALDRGARLTLFTGGPPLARPEIAGAVARLCRRGATVRVSLAGPTRASSDRRAGAERFEPTVAGLAALAALGAQARVDLMLFPDSVDLMVAELPNLRGLLPAGTPLALGIAYRGGREQGEHLFRSRRDLEAALDRIALEAGEAIPAVAPAPVTDRRESCDCADGRHLHVRSDGKLFSCFRMEEPVGEYPSDGIGEVWRRTEAQRRPASELVACRDCPLATLCGGGCRADNLLLMGDGDVPWCGPWRVRVLAELLAEDRVAALRWPAEQLAGEARRRGLDVPAPPRTPRVSLHLVE